MESLKETRCEYFNKHKICAIATRKVLESAWEAEVMIFYPDGKFYTSRKDDDNSFKDMSAALDAGISLGKYLVNKNLESTHEN